MSDRELLELAAKAAGIDAEWTDYELEGMWLKGARTYDNNKFWNPLTDDGDALRLAVKLNMRVESSEEYQMSNAYVAGAAQGYSVDWGTIGPAQALRDAVVKAAAEIGKAIP